MDASKPTPKAKTMATIDVSKLSSAELAKLIKDANALVGAKRKAELADIVKAFTDALVAAGFTKAEGVEALGGRAASSGGVVSRPKTGKGKKTGPQPKWGTTYKNPADGATWTKSATGKGRTVAWLQALVDGGKTFEEFAA